MVDIDNIKVYATGNGIESAKVIFFKEGDRCFLLKGVQVFKMNSLDKYEEITNGVIKGYLIKIHNELMEELMMNKKGLKEINPYDFYIG